MHHLQRPRISPSDVLEDPALYGWEFSADDIAAVMRAQPVQPIRLRLPYGLRDIDILVGDFALTRSYRLPEFIVDNPKFRNLGDDPAGFSLNPKKELKRAAN